MKNVIEKFNQRINLFDMKRVLFLIFIVATSIRILYLSINPGLSGPMSPFDPTEYNRMAINIISGKGFVYSLPPAVPGKPGWGNPLRGIIDNWYEKPTASRQPGYPLFLAGMHLIFSGKTYLVAVRLLECIIGGLTCIVAYKIGKNCFNKFVGITSSTIAAFYPFLIIETGTFMVETVYLFVISLAVLFLVKVAVGCQYKYFILSGLFFGLSTLFKSPIQLFPIVVIFWLLLYGKKKSGKIMIGLLLFFLSFVCVISPWIIRNKIVLGKATIGTGNGFTLWSANNLTTKPAFHQIDLGPGYKMVLDSLKKDNVDLTSEVEIDNYCLNKFKEFIRNNPIKFLTLTISRYIGFWKIFSSNVSIWLNIGSFFTYGILFLFMLPGIVFIFINKNINGILLILLLLYYSSVHSIILTYMRYRMPVEVYVIITAMYGLFEIIKKYYPQIRVTVKHLKIAETNGFLTLNSH